MLLLTDIASYAVPTAAVCAAAVNCEKQILSTLLLPGVTGFAVQ